MATSQLLASSGVQTLREYLAAPLGPAYARLANRLQLYPLLVLLFFLEGLLGWSLYQGPAFLLDRMAFTTVFSLHKALFYTLGLCAADLLAGYMPRKWGDPNTRSVGKQWLIWCAGFLLGFAAYRLIGICLLCFYAPELMSFLLASPQAGPGTATLVLFAVPSWFAAVWLTLQIAKARQRPEPPSLQAPSDGTGDMSTGHRHAPAPEGRLELWVDAAPVRLAHSRITHVSVEDHYCRIFFTKGEDLDNLLVRLPLKSIAQKLPASSFLQIHRSHMVNLRHASGIQKRGRAHSLALGRFALELPISRYRLAEVQPRLQARGPARGQAG